VADRILPAPDMTPHGSVAYRVVGTCMRLFGISVCQENYVEMTSYIVAFDGGESHARRRRQIREHLAQGLSAEHAIALQRRICAAVGLIQTSVNTSDRQRFSASWSTELKLLTHASTSVLVILERKCLLAASRAAPWRVTLSLRRAPY